MDPVIHSEYGTVAHYLSAEENLDSSGDGEDDMACDDDDEGSGSFGLQILLLISIISNCYEAPSLIHYGVCVCLILYFYPATCGPKGHGSGGCF